MRWKISVSMRTWEFFSLAIAAGMKENQRGWNVTQGHVADTGAGLDLGSAHFASSSGHSSCRDVWLLSSHTSHPTHKQFLLASHLKHARLWPLLLIPPSHLPSPSAGFLQWLSHSSPTPTLSLGFVWSPHNNHCDPCKACQTLFLPWSSLPAASHLPQNKIPRPLWGYSVQPTLVPVDLCAVIHSHPRHCAPFVYCPSTP